MARITTASQPESVIEHDGMLWRPKRGATATAEEFIAARTLFIELHRESRWNPWVLDDRKAELEHVIQVMDQWRRAEPGDRMLTEKQLEARLAKTERERERERELHEKERASHWRPLHARLTRQRSRPRPSQSRWLPSHLACRSPR